MTSKADIQALHQEIVGRPMDAKLAAYWEVAIRDGNKTLRNLEDVLLMSDDHVKRSVQVFKECYYDLVDYELPEDATQRFVDLHAKGKRVTSDDARGFICDLPEFKDKICKIFYIHKDGERPAKHVIDYFIEKFKRDPAYRIDDLSKDFSTQDIQQPFGVREEEFVNCDNAPIKKAEVVHKDFNNALLAVFETVFNRPMYVHEYFKYISKSVDELPEIFKQHTMKFNRLRQVMSMYTGRQLGEYEYIKLYLDAVDDENFFFDIIDEIVASADYKKCMCANLSSKYSKMFDEELEDYDVDYVFEKVRIEKLSLEDDQINDILVALKRETDEIIQHIFAVYLKVLMREPDIEEVQHLTRKYRSMLPRDLAEINKDTERFLMSSLEFHDILKSIVKAKYGEVNRGMNISMSKLYEMLNICIEKIEGCDMDDVGNVVSQIMVQL